MCRKCYVTTPIYYASGRPQLGNSYSSVAADVFARFNRLMHRDTFYLTGMDEHGQKIEEAANKALVSPKDFVDGIAEKAKEAWAGLNVKYDKFIRTTDDEHVECVQTIFEELLKKGDIYLGSYTGKYCVSCETFFTSSQLTEDGKCPDCGKDVKEVSEESYFLNLKKYSTRLLDFIKSNPDFIKPDTRRNEVVSFIESGLEDLCVSRTSFKWGIPVKSNPKHVVYVWIDALSNYISALGYNSNNTSDYKKYWLENSNIYHVIGKDILRFHAIYWPIMLMALDVPINFKLVVHGWLLNRDGKMSKSRGNAVYPEDLYTRYGSDSVRYYLAKELPLGNDGLFSFERFIERYNIELANDLGNLVSRTIAMVYKYFNGTLILSSKHSEFDASLEEVINTSYKNYINSFDSFQIQDAINEVCTIIRRTNKYIDETAPWTLAKDESNLELLSNVMYHLLESIKVTSCLIAPVMPNTSNIINGALNIDSILYIDELKPFNDFTLYSVNKVEPLFKRLDEKLELEYLNKQSEEVNGKVVKEETNNVISFDDFSKIELKVGVVLESKYHENANKLLVSKVDVGGEVRTIVSGIANFYSPTDIIGKKVIVVTNLAKATIRGVVSEGMILCASTKKTLELLEVIQSPAGSIVK